VIAQLGGAIVGVIAAWTAFGPRGGVPGRDLPAEGVSAGRAFLVEATITFVLGFVIMAVATDDRAPSAGIAPIAAGFALAVGRRRGRRRVRR